MTEAAALHLRFPAVTAAGLERELCRELEQRRRVYPRQVERARMLQPEAEREIALASAWLEDLRRIRHCWFEQPGNSPAAPEHGFTWKDRRAALLREIDFRARLYPDWIGKARLTQADADRQVACLECLLAIYQDGWDWRSSDGLTPFHSATADAEFNALQAEVAARQGTAQEEMAL